MPNTYTQIHIQSVFAVENRISLIHKNWERELYEYLAGIVRMYEHKPLIVNGMPDHIHMVYGLRPTQSISALMEEVKGSSSKWINDNHFVRGKFRWQKGFGAFSYSKSQLPAVIGYVENQKAHHKKKTFLDEYLEMLEKAGVEYDPRYIFKDPNIS